MNGISIQTTIDIKAEQLVYLLVAAFEGGINYWARIKRYDYGGKPKSDFEKEGGEYFFPIIDNSSNPMPAYAVLPLVGGGCAVVLEDADKPYGESPEWNLNRGSVINGLKLMSHRFPKHFADFIAGNEDAQTGDVFIQCCVLTLEIINQREKTGKWNVIFG